MIPYGRQDIDQSDIDAVVEVLKSDFLTQGPKAPAFAEALAERAGALGGVTVNSATSALHIACRALGLSEGGLLWTSPNSFVASSNAGLYCGADIDFVDIDPITRNMSVAALRAKLERAERKPDIVMPVHFSGRSCEMAEIAELGRRHGFRIIEDASHAVGARYNDGPVGDCRYSDICVYSFHPVKIVTTAEGGAALTNDAALLDRMRLLASHGVTRDPALMERPADDEPWLYDQVELGFNYRMTEMQAALGLAQLARLENFVERRAALARRYDERLSALDLGIRLSAMDDATHRSAWHLYVVELPEGRDRAAVFRAMRAEGVGVNVHYIPIHTQPYYRKLGFAPGDFPVAEAYYGCALTLPLHPNLSEADQSFVIETLVRSI